MGHPGDDVYSPDYETARDRFRTAAGKLGWRLEQYPIEAPHESDKPLTVDAASVPGVDDTRAVLVTSGLHGVEGFFGSAVQLEHFRRQPQRGDRPAVRCVFVHGLNPYGFARVRRANEDNVDPNRNFLLDGEAYSGSPPMYGALNSLLNPARPPSRLEPFVLKGLIARARYGTNALKQAIAGGQFDYPRGLFYGGSAPTATNRIVAGNLGRWLRGCSEVVHLDFHTGLGKPAACKLLIDYDLTDRQRTRLTKWFGPDSFEACDSNLTSYHVRGGFDRWCIAQIPDCDYLHLCAEFGTHGLLRVIAGLRAENQAHHWGKPGDSATVRAKERLKELFCPASPEWRSRALETGVGLIQSAINCLSTVPAGAR
jgi:hypothetical protein